MHRTSLGEWEIIFVPAQGKPGEDEFSPCAGLTGLVVCQDEFSSGVGEACSRAGDTAWRVPVEVRGRE